MNASETATETAAIALDRTVVARVRRGVARDPRWIVGVAPATPHVTATATATATRAPRKTQARAAAAANTRAIRVAAAWATP